MSFEVPVTLGGAQGPQTGALHLADGQVGAGQAALKLDGHGKAAIAGVLPSQGEVQALFLRHEGYLGAIGAFLKGAEQDSK